MISINKNTSNNDFAEKIKKATGGKDTAAMLSSLNYEERKLLDTLLKDEKARQEFLSSAETKKIISMLFGSR